jgi:transcriptional regulator with XRE-family HTH domain
VDHDAIYRSFGRAVAERRKFLGKTQMQVARAVGLSRASLANIERGSQKVFLHQVLALTEALDLDSSHEIVPSRAVPPRQTVQASFNVSGAKDLSKDQKAQIRNLVFHLADTKGGNR